MVFDDIFDAKSAVDHLSGFNVAGCPQPTVDRLATALADNITAKLHASKRTKSLQSSI